MPIIDQISLLLSSVLIVVPALTAKPPKSTQDTSPHIASKVTVVGASYAAGHDGSLDRAEIIALARDNPDLAQKAKPFDVDHDGPLSRTELCASFNAVALENKMAIWTALATPTTSMGLAISR